MCENIIGISKNGCGCKNINSVISRSGYYIDDTSEGRIPLNTTFYDCSDSNVESLLNRVIEDSHREVIEEINMRMDVSKKSSYFSTPIKRDYSGALAASNHYAFSLRPKMQNLKIFINDINYLQFSGTFGGNILVYKNGNQIDINPIGKSYKLDANLHFVVSGAPQPKDHKHRCCSQTYSCDHQIDFGSGRFNNLGDLKFEPSNYSHGFTLDATIDCDAWGFLCNMDFLNNPFANTFAKTLQLAARKNILEYLITSGKVNTYLTVMENEIENLREYLRMQLVKRYDFLADRYNFTDCKSCTTIMGGLMI